MPPELDRIDRRHLEHSLDLNLARTEDQIRLRYQKHGGLITFEIGGLIGIPQIHYLNHGLFLAQNSAANALYGDLKCILGLSLYKFGSL